MNGEGPVARGIGRARRHLGTEQTRSGYALLLSSVVTSGLGLLYWFGAARLVNSSELGQGAALVSAMLLVTSLSTAGLKRGLIRFIRAAGPGGRQLVVRVYAAGVLLALLFAAVFLAGAGDRIVEEIPELHHGLAGPLVMFAAVAIWAIFVLQDAALIGGRRAGAVPISNAAFSVLKLVALAALLAAPFGEQWAVLLSWVLPALVVAVAVNGWALRRGLRYEPERSTTDPPTVGTVLRFTSAEYVASLFWQGAVYLTPLIVLAEVGATSNAHFYLAFQIAYGIFLVSSNITDALVAEAAVDRAGTPARVRRACAQIALLLVPTILVLLVAAPQIMGLFGPGYRSEATGALRLLVGAGALNAATTVFVAIAHIRRRLTLVVVVHVTMSVITIGLALVLAPEHGIVGVGVAWVIAQAVSLVLGTLLMARLAWERRHRDRAVTVLRDLRRRLEAGRTRRRLPGLVDAIPEVVTGVAGIEVLSHQHDLTVLATTARGAPVVARVASSDAGRAVVAAHAASLDRVRSDARLGGVAHLVPEVLHRDDDDRWLVETRRPGRPVASVERPHARTEAVAAVLDALDRVHDATRHQVFAGAEELDAWVHRPIAAIAPWVRGADAADGLAALHARLVDELSDRSVTVALCHGDASIDNILVDADGSVTGMIDWESARTAPPEVDAFLLLLSRRTGWGGGELGEAVAEVLRDGWAPEEADLLAGSLLPNSHVRPTTLLLLAWIAHLQANLEKTDRYRANRWWLHHNVERVLEVLGSEADPVVGSAPDRSGVAAEPTPLAARATGAGRAARSTAPTVRPWVAARRDALIATSVVVAAGAAVALGWPGVLRVPLVLAALLAAPGIACNRRFGTVDGAARVVGPTFAICVELLAAEVLLYTHLWSPGLLLAGAGVATVALFAQQARRSGRPSAASPASGPGPDPDQPAAPSEAEPATLAAGASGGRR